MSEEVIEEETQPEVKEPKAGDSAVKDDGEVSKLKSELSQLKRQLKDAKDAEQAVRGNSDKLLKEKKDADAKLKALGDYDKVKKILAAVDDIDEAEKLAEGRHEEVFEERLARFKDDIHNPILAENADLKARLSSLETKVADYNKRPLIEAGWKLAKGKSDKLKYHYSEAARVFNLEDGSFVPRDAEGNVIYGTGGTDPITVEQYFNGVLTDEPDHKIASTGTTATGVGDGKIKVTVNPWSKDYSGGDKYALRAQISRDAPQKARDLKRAAGHTSRI